MNGVIDFFKNLFSTSEWPARWHCGNWTDFHGWLYIISDLMIWLAYFLIPVIIIRYFLKKKTSIRFQAAYLWFAAFILLCGATHFLDAMMFWIPMYRVNALVRFFTGITSLLTVYYLIKVLPQAFSQKTVIELENEITLRKEAEKQLAEANRNLEAFASIASHDLQEPLRKISAFTSLLNDRNNDKFDEPSKRYGEKIIATSARMQLLIRDILTMSSLKTEIELVPTDLNKPIQKALEDLELTIKEKNAIIHIGPMPVVMGNEHYLSQVFYNLIGNGIKFNQQQAEIHINADVVDGYTWVHVADNGIGMKEENYEKIFESFQRLHGKGEYPGTGLGLSITKKIVELHGGIIKVASIEGEGTMFSMRFKN
ncbi:sensor histidine kinase [Flavisolibacter ginsengisoli]|jgi:signal transduction histidine kinase|uniref:histidine kinase n=1 Tax=Flavisolibacter ginsengisoli DSM 18119 TaxID=1121884 RepID=A0A1M5ERH5_9BACT|nr:ATP-binding protein [Flavisolibacter ginsengisoli]SHF81721.1 His Kinase A (phospho-acceptor) domain-containing protein [Flavisolibacter ginsengisoli DSM 18119]